MNRKNLLALVAAAGMVLAVPTAAIAQDAPDPDAVEQTQTETESRAEATAAEVEGILVISKSEAGEGDATATALEIGGETVAGTEQTEPGESGGELIGTGETPLGELSVADHNAAVAEDGSSHADAALVRLVVVDGTVVDVEILASAADVNADGSSSSSSDGAVIRLGDGALTLRVLHAETTSDGDGTAYVVGVNDQHLITDEQTGGELCGIDARPLLAADIVCVSAAEGDEPVTAEVLDGDALDDNVLAELISSNAAPGDAGEGGETPGAPDDEDEPSGALPHTGASIFATALGGLLAVGAGAGLHRFGRRR